MFDKIKIDSDVPLPKRAHKIPLPDLPLDQMKVGQSFALYLPAVEEERMGRILNALRMKVQRYQRGNPGYRFSVVTESPESIRVFRVENH